MLDFLKPLAAEISAVPAEIQHAALWLVTAVKAAGQKLHEIEEQNPLVAEALHVGTAALQARGIPITALANAGSALLAAAQALAAHTETAS